MIRLLQYCLSYSNGRSESKVWCQHGSVHIIRVMTSRMYQLVQSALYSIIVAILAGFIFASLSAVLDIKAAPPPKVSAELLDEFFSSRNASERRLPDTETDTETLPELNSVIAITVTVTQLSTGDPSLPGEYFLSQNYPNPFNATTIIEYSLPEQTFVRLEIYNTLGQRVSVLVDRVQPAGNYTLEWRGDNRASGIYFCRIMAGQYRKTRKMALIK